jgi:hypothetical protein
MSKEKAVLDKVLTKPNDKDFINRMVMDQNEDDFPKASEIEVTAKYVDPFEPPDWLDKDYFAYSWVDLRDDIGRHRALDTGFFKIVTRTSSCIKGKINDRDFRDHGAVERQGMILVFRPKDLDEKLRTHSVLKHGDMVSSISAGKQESGYETTFSKSKEDTGSSGIDVYAYEEPGVHALEAKDLKPGNLQVK